MDTVLVRYSEIGTKSRLVRSKMVQVLRQRLNDRLEYEELSFEKVSTGRGRITVETTEPRKVAKALSEMPGVASTSPAKKCSAEIEDIKKISEEFEVGETFGVKTNRAGEHDFNSQDVNVELGSFIESETGSKVDLDNPETWVEVDVRFDHAYVFSERFEGPKGFPVSDGSYAALISGGIDSPVAAYRMMTRGSDILPVYFYNKPIAAEDHLLRFKSSARKLKRYNPSKSWEAYVVDMEPVNRQLMKVERGRMLIHRQIMFAVAEKIAEKEGLNGIVTGESVSQKSSQTASNLELTSSACEKPIFRPVLTASKSEIVGEARNIGTYEESKIDSACQTMAPESPATSMGREELRELKQKVGFESLVEKAFDSVQKTEL